MGKHLISILLGTIVLLLGIEWFSQWYHKFLQRQKIPLHIKRAIEQGMWVLLALLLWNALYRKFLPEEFDSSYLLFALFIFSLRGMVIAFLRRE